MGLLVQKSSGGSVANITAPTFAGISGLVQNSDGSLTASYSAASGVAAAPFAYYVYIQAGTATGLFNSANVTRISLGLSQRIFLDASLNVLQPGTTYFVGVRAVSATNVFDSNVVSLSAAVTNANYNTLAAAVWDQLKSAHTIAGSFGIALQANVDVNTSTLAPASTAVSNADYTTARAVKLDFLDALISSRAPSSTALSTAQWTNTRAALLDFLDATISSRAPSSTALSTAQWTNARALLVDYLDAAISSRATQTSVTAIPTNPLLTTDARLNNLDATISSRLASAGYTAPDNATIGTINTKIGTPAATVSTDITSVKSDTSGLRTDYTTTRAVKIDNLDATISSRLATASYTAPDNIDIASIKVQTDKMLFDGSSFIKANAQITIDDTNILAIKTQTDKFQFDGSNNVKANTLILSDITVTGNITGIKSKTDNLPSDPASQSTTNSTIQNVQNLVTAGL